MFFYLLLVSQLIYNLFNGLWLIFIKSASSPTLVCLFRHSGYSQEWLEEGKFTPSWNAVHADACKYSECTSNTAENLKAKEVSIFAVTLTQVNESKGCLKEPIFVKLLSAEILDIIHVKNIHICKSIFADSEQRLCNNLEEQW